MDARHTRHGRRGVGRSAVLAAGLLLAGCVQPLATQDPFMDPFNSTANGIGQRVSGLVAEGRARQAAGRACIRIPHDACPPGPVVPPRPDPRSMKAVEAWEAGEAKQPEIDEL